MTLLGIDVGTTHCKVGLFHTDGVAVKIASRPMVTHHAPEGSAYFDPQQVWSIIVELLQEVTAALPQRIKAIGITSMAETGLLIDRHNGAARSHLIPWFDTTAQSQADALERKSDRAAFYSKTGLYPSYKCSLAKLLWLMERDPHIVQNAIWLSASDYVAYRLTHAFGTDYSLAGRTCAFDIAQKQWDTDCLQTWGIAPEIFPPAHPSGTPIGETRKQNDIPGLPTGIPAAVSGHDHVCAALAVGAVMPGVIFDSMGTAEALLGTLPERPLTVEDYHRGLMVGCHVAQGYQYWMGGLSTSGGAVEWLRKLLGDTPLSYDALVGLVAGASPDPTGILFFPYLLGSGSPHRDASVRGAFIGLKASHTRSDLAKAVLEGTAFEAEFIRRAGVEMTGYPVERLTVAGGGTRNRQWLQIKADVSGCQIQVSPEPEATLLGAALAAGIGCGVYTDTADALAQIVRPPGEIIAPDPDRHRVYHALFESGYLGLQAPLRALGCLP